MDLRAQLRQGLVIPAHPLALTAERKLDERHQRALTRYYVAAGAGGIASTAAALGGTWQVTYTLAEFSAAGADPSEASIPSNIGHFMFSFSKGRWRMIGPPGGSASGTYSVTGDRITFYRHDHAYAGSDTEVWGPYIWSVYRDTLRFKKAGPPGIAMPTGLVVKPWRKTGT